MYMSLNNTGGSWRRRRKLFHSPILNLLASTSLSLISSLWLQAKNWCLASTTRRTPLSCTGFIHIYNCKGGNWVNPTKKMITRPTFRRLEEMNQRWNYLKAKSIAIRWPLVLNSLILKANGTPPLPPPQERKSPLSDQFRQVKSIPLLLKNRKNVNNNEPFPYTCPLSLSLSQRQTHRL